MTLAPALFTRLGIYNGLYDDTVNLNPLQIIYNDANDATPNNRINLNASTISVDGNNGNDFINGTSTALLTILNGGDGSDQLYGGNGIDTINGDAGNDWLEGGGGLDILNGGADEDTVGYERMPLSAVGLVLTLGAQGAQTTATVNGVAADLVQNIENVVGTNSNDTITGNTGFNKLMGLAGADILSGGGGNDWLEGGMGADTLNGGSGNDTLAYEVSAQGVTINLNPNGTYITTANNGDATGDLVVANTFENVWGSPVNDTITGDAGVNTINGGNGQDTLSGGGGNDIMHGDDGSDLIFGDAGNDVINGGNGNDTLDGGADNDTISGGEGNDNLVGKAGADSLNGGNGTDTGDYSASLLGVTVDLGSAGPQSGGDAQGDTLVSIEDLYGSFYAGDRLTGNAGINFLWGRGGNDILIGGLGDDYLIGGAGADHMDGGDGYDTVDYSSSPAGIHLVVGGVSTGGDAAGDTLIDFNRIIGTLFADYIDARLDPDPVYIDGGEGNDTEYGGAGDTIMVVEDVVNDMHAGTGNTTFVFNPHTFDGSLDLGALYENGINDTKFDYTQLGIIGGQGITIVETDAAPGDTHVEIDYNGHHVHLEIYDQDPAAAGLSAFAAAAAANNVHDQENLSNGNDNVTLASHDDIVFGLLGNDIINGGGGVDVIDGGDGDDTISGGAGDDDLKGGGGIDTVDYSTSGIAIGVRLDDGTASDGTQDDTLSGIENVTGTAFADIIVGDDGNNVIRGGAGTDTIHAEGGNDRIEGGGGVDDLHGGLGNDAYVYNSLADAPIVPTVNDEKVEFTTGDKIDLSAIDAITGTPTDDAFTLLAVGTGFTGHAGEIEMTPIQQFGVEYHQTVLGDVDGDGVEDFEFTVIRDVDHINMTAADFVL